MVREKFWNFCTVWVEKKPTSFLYSLKRFDVSLRHVSSNATRVVNGDDVLDGGDLRSQLAVTQTTFWHEILANGMYPRLGMK